MGPSRKAIADEFLRLHKSSPFAWAGQWISDEQWMKYIANNAEPLSSLTVRDFNEAISKDDRFKPFLRSEEWNANGLYFNKVKVYHHNVFSIMLQRVTRDLYSHIQPRNGNIFSTTIRYGKASMSETEMAKVLVIQMK